MKKRIQIGWKNLLVLFPFFLFLGFFGFTPSGFGKKKHPKIEAEMITEDPQVCVSCHAEQHRDWEKSLHGLNQVRCFICHGDLEKRFERIASASNCVACHSDKVEDLEKTKYKSCFACHAAHTLDVKSGSKNIHRK